VKLACVWWLSLGEIMMLSSLDFWYDVGTMSKEMSQVVVACKGEDKNAQVCE